MSVGHEFRRLTLRHFAEAPRIEPSGARLRALLYQRIVKRFARIAGRKALPIVVEVPTLTNGEDPPPSPAHPACTQFDGSDYCRESWQLHVACSAEQGEAPPGGTHPQF